MRPGKLSRSTLCWVALCTLVTVPDLAKAGLYNPCEVVEGPFLVEFFDKERNNGFQLTLLKYRSCSLGGVTVENPFRQRYLLVEELQKTRDGAGGGKSGADALTDAINVRYEKLQQLRAGPGDRQTKDEAIKLQGEVDLLSRQLLSLSEYLIRRKKCFEAYGLLYPQAHRAGDNFLILANLATACQQLAEGKTGGEKASDYQKAVDYQMEALRLWPRTWEELKKKSPRQRQLLVEMFGNQDPQAAYLRCRKAEEYFLKLLRSRAREARRPPAEVGLDTLFTSSGSEPEPMHFVGEDGKFSPGRIAAGEKGKLPGQSVDEALGIVQQLLVWQPTDARLYWQLGELYNAAGTPDDLRAAQFIFYDLVHNMEIRYPDLQKHQEIMDAFPIPPSPPRVLPATVLNRGDTGANPKKATGANPPVLWDWNKMTVTFGLGFVLALFGQWQVREILRRRSLARRP